MFLLIKRKERKANSNNNIARQIFDFLFKKNKNKKSFLSWNYSNKSFCFQKKKKILCKFKISLIIIKSDLLIWNKNRLR